MATLPATFLTEVEYLRIERQASAKSEFHNGEVFALSGGSPNHALLCGSMVGLLFRELKPGCRVFTSDMRIHIPATRTYTYPDCSVICGDIQTSNNEPDSLLNPTLLVEVLSPSSENYDRGKKFEIYRHIRSLQEYLIVHQDRRCLEHHSKQPDGSWLLREHSGNENSVSISSLGVRIPLAELYAPTINCF